MGGFESTWTATTWRGKNKEESLWLRDFLPNAVAAGKIPACRVLSFGYDANVLCNDQWNGLLEQAQELLSLLNYKRRGPLGVRSKL
jgi:hypothetical protein